MWCRALLAAIAVTYLLCVLILNGIQKEDLDESTLQKLQRHNVNINDLNNEKLRNKCKILEKAKNKEKTTTKENTTEENTTQKNTIKKDAIKNGTTQKSTSKENDGTEDGTTLHYETPDLAFKKHNGNENKNQERPPNQFEPKTNGYMVNKTNKENNISDTENINCNDYIKYNNGQPTLNTMLNFWKNCVNKSNGSYEMQLNIKSVPIYTTESNFKIKQNNWLGDPSNKNFSEIDNFTQKSLRQENTQEMKQISPKRIDLDDLYYYTPSTKYDTKSNMENIILEQLRLTNQNLKNGQANSKLTPGELLMQKLHTVFNNYNSQILKRDNYKDRSEIRVDSYLNRENEPYRDSLRRESVKLDESSKIIPNISNSNFLYRQNIPIKEIYRRESVKADVSPNYFPVIPDDKFFYSKIDSNKYTHIRDIPKFINSIADENRNEPYKDPFRRKAMKVNYLPKINPNTIDAKFFYPESEPKTDNFQSESVRVDDTSKIIKNIPKFNIVHGENIPNKNSLRRTSEVEETSKLIPNDGKLYSGQDESNNSNFPSVIISEEDSSRIIPNIPKRNFSYRDNIPNNDSHRKKTVKINNTSKFIKRRKYELNKYSHSRESENVDKSAKIHNIPNGKLFDQENDSNVDSFKKETVKMDDTSKTIPNIPHGNILFSENIPNKDSYFSKKIDESPKFIPGMAITEGKFFLGETEPTKSWYKKKNADETSESISSTPDDNPNKDSLKNESVKVEQTKTIPTKEITDIAESVKAIILKDLKKELNIFSTTFDGTVGTTPLTRTTQMIPVTEHTPSLNMINETAIQEAIMNKVITLLKQMNILKGNAVNVNRNNSQPTTIHFPPNNKNTNILKSDFKTSTTETVYILSEDTPIYKHVTRPDNFNFVPQLHKNRDGNKDHKIVKQVNKPQVKVIQTGPLTFQTNSLEIRPLGVYMDKFQDPVNQNIVLTTSRSNVMNHQSDIKTKLNIGHWNFKSLLNKPVTSNYLQNAHNSVINNVNTNEDLETSMSGGIHSKYNNNYKEEDINPKYNNYKEEYQMYTDRYVNNNNAHISYGRPENIEHNLALGQKQPVYREDCCERQYIMSKSIRDCCNDRVVSRQQVSLNNDKNRPYVDAHYKSFINSQQKVNDMLEKLLTSRTRSHSVENI